MEHLILFLMRAVGSSFGVLLNVQRQLFHELCKRIADDFRPYVHKWFEESVPALRVPRKTHDALAAEAFGRSPTDTIYFDFPLVAFCLFKF